MKIDAYVICYNEIKLAPFAVQYWKRFANRVYVYDNWSTDGTVEYLQQFPFIEIRHFDSKGVDDAKFLEIKNNAWKQSRNTADFVTVSDFDEFIYSEDMEKSLEKMKEGGYDICEPVWFNAVSESFPDFDGVNLMHTKVKGVPHMNESLGWSKALIFNPNTIYEINYTPGAHNNNALHIESLGKKQAIQPKVLTDSNIFCLHAVNLGKEYILEKKRSRALRMSMTNLKMGWGIHYLYDDKTILKEFEDNLNKAKELVFK